MEAQLIDIGDWEYAGEGANGSSWNHRSDDSVMMKLYNEGAPLENVMNEVEYAHKVYASGIPTPQPGVPVTDGKRFGLMFQRMPDKKSFSRACGDEPEKAPEYGRRFAAICRTLHSTHLDTNGFRNIKDIYLGLLESNPYFTADEKVKVAAFINAAPDTDTAIHGDLQFSNVIMSGGRDYFIDLGDFAYGCPLFDLGMVLLTSLYDDVEFLRNVFHMEPETARKFWEGFVPAYFGEDADPAGIERMLRPYAGLKVLIIERDCGVHFPQYHALLDGITG